MKYKFIITILVLTFAFGFLALANILIPNDSLFDAWDENDPAGNNYGQEIIKLPSAWNLTTGLSIYPIAVIDSGFDIKHEDLKPNLDLALSDQFDILTTKNKDADSHGTHIAGIISAKGNNELGIAGTIWDANLRLYNYTFPTSSLPKSERVATSLSIVTMINSAVDKGANVINLSAGYCLNEDINCALTKNKAKLEDLETFDNLIEAVAKLAKLKGKGVLFVFAAGNNKGDLETVSPARMSSKLDNFISVAAIDKTTNLANYSNWGDITVAAPGGDGWPYNEGDIFSTLPDNQYGYLGGTSMAAPFVSGLAGLIWSRAEELGKTLTAAEVKQLIIKGAENGEKFAVDPDGNQIPIINAYESLKLLEPEPSPPVAAAWPMFGHNATRSGQSKYVGPQTNNIKWNYTSDGWWSQAFGIVPIVGPNDTIYIGNENQGKLYAFNPDSTIKWTFSDNNNPLGTRLSIPAAANDGTVYIGSDTGVFYAVNPDGTLKWKYALDPVRQIGGSPVIGSDGTIYFSTIYASTNSLYALNPDGTLKWTFGVNKGSQTTTANPAIGSDGTIYVSFWEDGLYALNPDKSIKWQDSELTVGSPLVGSDGTIYVIIARPEEYGNLILALNPDGTEKWTYSGVDRKIKPAVSSDGIIFAKGRHINGQYVTEFWAIKSNGTLKWKNSEIGYAYLSTPAIGADGLVYIATATGLYALNPIDGTIKWKKEGLCCSSPAIDSNGILYYGTYDKGIYAFGE